MDIVDSTPVTDADVGPFPIVHDLRNSRGDATDRGVFISTGRQFWTLIVVR